MCNFRLLGTQLALWRGVGWGRPFAKGLRGMANLMTLIRFVLLFVIVVVALEAPPAWQLVNLPLLAMTFALDAVDGYVARRRGEASQFGSVFDVVADRVSENVLWIVLAYLGLVGIWVPIVFITRGVIVDALRYRDMARAGASVYSSVRSKWGRRLMSSRWVRGTYGTVKALAFAVLLLIPPLSAVAPQFWAASEPIITAIAAILVNTAVVLCLLRGMPVVLDCLVAERVIKARYLTICRRRPMLR